MLPPPLPVTTKNALPDASKINYGIKIALLKSFILHYEEAKSALRWRELRRGGKKEKQKKRSIIG